MVVFSTAQCRFIYICACVCVCIYMYYVCMCIYIHICNTYILCMYVYIHTYAYIYGPYSQHMEFPWPRIKSCGRYLILSPLHRTGDQTQASTETQATAVGSLTHCTIAGTSRFIFFKSFTLGLSSSHGSTVPFE